MFFSLTNYIYASPSNISHVECVGKDKQYIKINVSENTVEGSLSGYVFRNNPDHLGSEIPEDRQVQLFEDFLVVDTMSSALLF